MNQQQSNIPNYQPSAEQVAPIAVPVKNKRKILGLWLLIGPTALIIGSIILYAVVNFILASTAPAGGEMFESPSVLRSILNTILFLAGVVSVVTWLPGIIAGIILLTTQKKS